MLNNNICTTIEEIQKGEMDGILLIIEQFEPLLKKYSFKLNYEDAYNELRLFLINLMCELDLEKISNKSDGAIVNYVKKSIYNEYVRLVKSKIGEKDKQYIVDTDENLLEKVTKYNDDYSLLFFQSIKTYLTEDEYTVIFEIFYNGRSVSETSKIIDTSVWNVYKLRDKALKKLKVYI